MRRLVQQTIEVDHPTVAIVVEMRMVMTMIEDVHVVVRVIAVQDHVVAVTSVRRKNLHVVDEVQANLAVKAVETERVPSERIDVRVIDPNQKIQAAIEKRNEQQLAVVLAVNVTDPNQNRNHHRRKRVADRNVVHLDLNRRNLKMGMIERLIIPKKIRDRQEQEKVAILEMKMIDVSHHLASPLTKVTEKRRKEVSVVIHQMKKWMTKVEMNPIIRIMKVLIKIN